MGAQDFYQEGEGSTAEEAFRTARKDACYEQGHGGYSGTLAEKHSFVLIHCPEGIQPEQLADQLIENDDKRISDKWGPAGCIKVKTDKNSGLSTYLFFGWASS